LTRRKRNFEPENFLATMGVGRKVVAFPKKEISPFAAGRCADSVFYIREGKIRLTVVSTIGKEATLGLLSEGDFFGERRPWLDNL